MSDIIIREVQSVDVQQGLLETLAALSPATADVLKAALLVCEQQYGSAGRLYPKRLTFVAQSKGGNIVGTASLLIERKLIHDGGAVGHIEDVAVHPLCQRQGLGKKLVSRCIEAACQHRCYKVVLTCNEFNIPFYAGLGFRPHEVGMRLDLSEGGVVEETKHLPEDPERRNLRRAVCEAALGNSRDTLPEEPGDKG